MGIRDQRIDIGYGISVIKRCVYDIRSNDRLKFQTGFVQYDNNEVPVWRPYDPQNLSIDAPWKNGKWQSIYALRMVHRTGKKYVEYETTETEFNGLFIPLPMVSTELMHAFKAHLEKVNG